MSTDETPVPYFLTGLTPEQEEALDGAIPDWREMTPEEIHEASRAYVDTMLDAINEIKGLP